MLWVFFGMAISFGVVTLGGEGKRDGGQDDITDATATVQLREIAQGYFANRESFPFFTCRFMVVVGSASTESEAIEGGPTTEEVAAKGRALLRTWRFRPTRPGPPASRAGAGFPLRRCNRGSDRPPARGPASPRGSPATPG